MELANEEIVQDIRNLHESVAKQGGYMKKFTKNVENLDIKICTLDKKVNSLGEGSQVLGKKTNGMDKRLESLSTKVEVTGSVVANVVNILDKLNANGIRAEEQIKRIIDRFPRID